GCVSDTVEVNISLYDSLFVVAFEDSVICPNGNIELETVSVSGGHGSFSFQWSNNGSVIGNGNPYDYTQAGEGTVCVTVSDACETPPVQDCFELSFEEAMPFSITSDVTSGCAPLDVEFELTTNPSLYTAMSWNFDSAVSPSNSPEEEFNYELPGLYDVGVYMVSPRGCAFNHIFEDYIEVFSDPVAGWNATPMITTIYDPEIQFTSTSLGLGLSYYWVFNTAAPLGTSTAANPAFVFPDNKGGGYNVSLSIKDEHGCTDKVEGIVDINDVFVVYVPNAFTPDGDGINDVFTVMGADIREDNYELQIFNRWGDLIFESHTLGEPWIGNTRGSDHFAPDGVYTYVVRAASISTVQDVELTGFVLLIR
ncbi:MAG: gliding motility-associated C-terminal domain-containing protein, partial [Crocinitomicaceae bacterium]|nr:gliding motility-associated C-terminal domain-containing protein [Crocinitomicaceae bacterium]